MEKFFYQDKVDTIQKCIDEKNFGQASKLLEELYQYKPVRLAWYHLKAQIDRYTTKTRQAYFDSIAGKHSFEYNYPGVKECVNMYEKLSVERENRFDSKKFKYLSRILNDDFSFYPRAMEIFSKNINSSDFYDGYEKYLELYALGELVVYELQHCYHAKVYPNKADVGYFKAVMKKQTNMGYWTEVLKNEKNGLFVVIEGQDNQFLVDWIKHMLCSMGKKVCIFRKPMRYASDTIDIRDTISISVDSMLNENNCYEIVPVEIEKSNSEISDNRKYLLRYVYEKCSEQKAMHILATGWDTESLCLGQQGKIRMHRLSAYSTELMEHNMALSFYGDYMMYISSIYMEDCQKLIEQKSTKRFSIVIPARNSAATLRYTLQTCLEQTFQGDYEIIISDNSTDNSGEVYDLCRELNNNKIIYIKTPRDLHLPKSFEFAYLHTQGEYVLALGSDDGLLPWALEILDAVTKNYPDEEIVQWERGFYAWPGFNGGQENQFIIPDNYEKGKLHLHYRTREHYLNSVIQNEQNMYSLPMLYINSCFKRSYLQTLLNQTGRLWDGICQDIYMGIVTAVLHEKILNMRYPLSIAGMSSGSVGANANRGKLKDEEFHKMMAEQKKDNNVGGFCRTYIERLLPDMGTDTASLYSCLLRAVAIGALPEEYINEKFDWKTKFLRLFAEIDIRDVIFDRKIHTMRYAASKHGEEFLKWFDDNIYMPALMPVIVDEIKLKELFRQKSYKEKTKKCIGVVLDASKRGVNNVYDATKLFAQMTGL